MITERTLKKWRKEALQIGDATNIEDSRQVIINTVIEWQLRILRMSQELLDQHLLRKE